jgi:hypothetical protein
MEENGEEQQKSSTDMLTEPSKKFKDPEVLLDSPLPRIKRGSIDSTAECNS